MDRFEIDCCQLNTKFSDIYKIGRPNYLKLLAEKKAFL